MSRLRNGLLILLLVSASACAPGLGRDTAIVYTGALSPNQLAASGGSLWFSSTGTSNDTGYVGSVTAQLSVETYAIALAAAGGVVAAGGQVWFTGQSSVTAMILRGVSDTDDKTTDFVGDLDVSSGRIAKAIIPTRGAFPGNMARAADGTIFFSEQNANAIGELRDGKITEHRLPGGLIRDDSGPRAIAAGNDGVYFIEDRDHRVGELTKSNQWRYVYTRHLSAWSSLVATRDGIWFTDPKHHELGLISTHGDDKEVQTFDVPWSGVAPVGIAADEAGSIYFTTGDGYFGRYRLGVGFAQIPIPHYNSYYGLPDHVAAADGKLWYSYPLLHGSSIGTVIGFVKIGTGEARDRVNSRESR